MRQEGKAPNPLVQTLIGWRASRMADPVERLRFLRRTVGDRSGWERASVLRRTGWRDHRGMIVIVCAALLLLPAGALTGTRLLLLRRTPVLTPPSSARPQAAEPQVWMVEQKPEYETYSNGLRIERRYEVGNEPRTYVVYHRELEDMGGGEEWTRPVGVVFHSTESPQAEFREDQTKTIRRMGAGLLEFVKTEKAYHYVVDRFGRVWRIVKESDTANHAGWSVWADEKWTYFNLNRSFLGISVETMTQPGAQHTEATPAQIHALRVLTEMLRARYHISVENCTTHAQVSVNPDNMQVGYHYDWATNFPYSGIGLPNNYNVPNPGMWLFGFTYDASLVQSTGEPYWKGLLMGEEQLRQNATAHGMSVPAYRQVLARRFRDILAAYKAKTDKSKERKG